MSTHCGIAELLKNGSIKMTTSHWDGGYEYKGSTGWTLNKYYRDNQKVDKLINLGQLSSVGKDLTPSPEIKQYGFDMEKLFCDEHLSENQKNNIQATDQDHVHAYHRDRGEKQYGPWTYPSLAKAEKAINKVFWDLEYVYLYNQRSHAWHLIYKYQFMKSAPTLNTLIKKTIRKNKARQEAINKKRPTMLKRFANNLKSYISAMNIDTIQQKRGMKSIYNNESLRAIIENINTVTLEIYIKYLSENAYNKILNYVDKYACTYGMKPSKINGAPATFKSVLNTLQECRQTVNENLAQIEQ